MSSITSNSSHTRSRSLRSNTLNLKPPVAPTAQPVQGPSSIALFLINLRLLDLDLLDDWPDITLSTISSRDQKKRIQSIEWALYQLFVLWDPEEAREKLQPFYPPLEPLQSLNLRAALLRCLEQAKKSGVLGRETILRKTMLDECKGERLEEILAIFSNAVLKRVLQETNLGPQALAQQLALENFSYSGERSLLSALIVAHKASLSKHLRDKEASRAQYQDFSNLLDLNERRVARRHEQLKQVVEEHSSRDQISAKEITALQAQVQKNWSGAEQWLDTILYGDTTATTDDVLTTPFDKIWKHVESGSIGDIEGKKQIGLLDQLDMRVKEQEARLARWQNFGKTLKKTTSPLKSKEQVPTQGDKIELEFSQHQSLQLPRSQSTNMVAAGSMASLEEYTRLIDNLKTELAEVEQPRPAKDSAARGIKTPDIASSTVSTSPSQSPITKAPVLDSPKATGQNFRDKDEDWTSESDGDKVLPTRRITIKKTHNQTSNVLIGKKLTEGKPTDLPTQRLDDPEIAKIKPQHNANRDHTIQRTTATSQPCPQTPPTQMAASLAGPAGPTEESILADQILTSVSASSPSPKKRHTLSLAERTRLSMSRASHSKYSELYDEYDDITDLPRLSIKPMAEQEAKAAADPDIERHADLISRTRKSMAGFEAAQKKAHIERRRSVKEAKKKQRESSYFPRVVEEEPVTPSLDAVELIEGDPDYESVFKSRPKIATSPALSPSRIWEEDD